MQIVVTLVLALFSLLAGYGYGVKDGAQHVQAKWDKENSDNATAQRDKEAELQASMDKLREDKNRETAKLRRTVAALTDSLRNRPERPAVPEIASAGDGASGCTGAELYKPDGNFLVGEAARADQLRLALKVCQEAYQSASQSASN
jgi:hypothetical protein